MAENPQRETELVVDAGPDEEALVEGEELPVVARMVVEIRSDGSRTIARGAVEDLLNEQQVAVEASAGSPLELSRALAKMLFSAPFAAGGAALRGQGRAESPAIDAGPEPAREGLRERVGIIGRDLGSRVARKLLDRVLRDDVKDD